MNKERFCYYLEQFIVYLKETLRRSPHTCRAYKTDLSAIQEFWDQSDHASKSFKQVVYAYLNHHITQKSHDKKTFARKISCLSTFEKFLAHHEIIVELELKRPAIKEETPDHLTIKEILFLLDEIPEEQLPSYHPSRDKAILELLYATGIRPSELVAITLQNINLTEQTIVIPQSKKAPRVVLFGSKAASQLERYLTFERPAIVSLSEHLFLNYQAQPLTTRSIQRICNMFSTFLPRACIITPSLLRHSCAVHLLQEGSDLLLIQELLGTTRLSAEKYLGALTKTS